MCISELSDNNWDLDLRRSLYPEESNDWQCLVACILVLLEEEDSVVWPHFASGHFSIKSLCAKLISGTPTTKFKLIWHAWIPPKIKVFFMAGL